MNYSTKLFKHFYVTLSILLFGILVQSCQPDDGTDSGDIRDEYVGNWNCSENGNVFGQQNYSVTISKGLKDDEIKVANFYNIGDDSLVILTVFDNNISVNTQTVDGNQFLNGEGTSLTDYSEFTLEYNVITGGDNDNVKATFTK